MVTQESKPIPSQEIKRAEPGRYLSFLLENEIYALSIHSVSEINGITEITTVPHTPNFVKGVINLRGKVIPVVDLRLKFGMKPTRYTKETCIIIAETWARQIGVIVDTVKEVLDLTREEIESTPELGDKDKTKFITGMGKKGDTVVIIVDINAALSPEELNIVSTI